MEWICHRAFLREENSSYSAIASAVAAAVSTRLATATITAASAAITTAAAVSTRLAALRTGRAKSAARSFGPVHHRGRTALHHRRTDPNRLLLLRRLTRLRPLPILLGTGKVARRKLRLLRRLRSGLLDGLRGPLRSRRTAIESAAIGSTPIGST